KRMRFERLRLEFRMELAAEVIRMICDLANLDVHAVRRFARDPEAVRSQNFFELAIEFEAMPMPFADFSRPVRLLGKRAGLQHAGPRAQPHSAAQFVDAFQLAQL